MTVIAEVLAHRATSAYGAKNCSGAGSEAVACDNDRILKRAEIFERLNQLSNRRTLLADSDVDADRASWNRRQCYRSLDFWFKIVSMNHGRLTGLTVTDDQFALATANRDQRVDGLQARLHRLVNRFTRDNARCFDFDQSTLGRIQCRPYRRSGCQARQQRGPAKPLADQGRQQCHRYA